MERYTFWERGRKVWAFSGITLEIERMEILGIKALTKGKALKPSTAFLRVIGKYASKNFVNLEASKALKFLRGEEIELPPTLVKQLEMGYVIVKSDEDILGCGFFDGKLKSLIPSKYRLQDTWV